MYYGLKKKKVADPPFFIRNKPRQAILERSSPPPWKKSAKIMIGILQTNH